MTDSSLYTSLFALVDSHLSRVSLNDDDSYDPLNVSKFNSASDGSAPNTSILPVRPGRKLPSFGIGMGDIAIRNVLAEQVANMLKAKEKEKKEEEEEEERAKLEKEMKRLKIEEEKLPLIDLSKAIEKPYRPDLPRAKKEILSNSSSCESLCKLNWRNVDITIENIVKPSPLQPCITDISYILKQKTRRSKGSSFGKVISSRQRRVAAPYLMDVVKSDIVRFDFSTPSPCDIIREKMRKPKMSCRFTITLEEFMANLN